ncbi:MAG: T9SS type A sorting domain-containing protein, partial [Bacteroidales bacterium]|nr:T9SS type A sorting domain-containing protein [Bacteroidales bacterium]
PEDVQGFSIYSVIGVQVITGKLTDTKEFQIDINQLERGVYFLNIDFGNRREILKFIRN